MKQNCLLNPRILGLGCPVPSLYRWGSWDCEAVHPKKAGEPAGGSGAQILFFLWMWRAFTWYAEDFLGGTGLRWERNSWCGEMWWRTPQTVEPKWDNSRATRSQFQMEGRCKKKKERKKIKQEDKSWTLSAQRQESYLVEIFHEETLPTFMRASEEKRATCQNQEKREGCQQWGRDLEGGDSDGSWHLQGAYHVSGILSRHSAYIYIYLILTTGLWGWQQAA